VFQDEALPASWPSCRRTTCASEREWFNCLFECNGQSANPQNDRGLIIVIARFGISRRRKCDNTDFARCQPFRRPTRTLCRFTRDRRIALQVLSPAFGERLHEVDRFPCHEVFRVVETATAPGSFGGCRSMTASLRSMCAQSRTIAIYFADTGEPPQSFWQVYRTTFGCDGVAHGDLKQGKLDLQAHRGLLRVIQGGKVLLELAIHDHRESLFRVCVRA
jgi:hypothetical protein